MAYSFSPVAWSFNINLYEVNIRQYTKEGTFQAFATHLPRLKEMGVHTLWFMPITPISLEKRQGTLGSYYACSSYVDTNPEFGTVDDFRQLVRQAHEMGFKAVIDWVANHTGWDHDWTKSNPGFYKRNAAGEFYDSNNWHDVIDLNYYDHAMRREMIRSMSFWVKECDIDGFRCDMAHLVPLDFWRDARSALDAVKPLFWLAETEHVNYQTVFDCSYAWHWMHDTERFAKDQIRVPDLVSTLKGYQQKVMKGCSHLFFTSNHDENSWNGTEYEKYGPATKVLAVLSCTWDGIPLIYSGQEIPNMERLQFFDRDPIDWGSQTLLKDFYKSLLELRSRNSSLWFGHPENSTTFIDTSSPDSIVAFQRKSTDHKVLVILNFSSHEQEITIQDTLEGKYTDVLTGKSIELKAARPIMIGVWDALVLES